MEALVVSDSGAPVNFYSWWKAAGAGILHAEQNRGGEALHTLNSRSGEKSLTNMIQHQ